MSTPLALPSKKAGVHRVTHLGGYRLRMPSEPRKWSNWTGALPTMPRRRGMASLAQLLRLSPEYESAVALKEKQRPYSSRDWYMWHSPARSAWPADWQREVARRRGWTLAPLGPRLKRWSGPPGALPDAGTKPEIKPDLGKLYKPPAEPHEGIGSPIKERRLSLAEHRRLAEQIPNRQPLADRKAAADRVRAARFQSPEDAEEAFRSRLPAKLQKKKIPRTKYGPHEDGCPLRNGPGADHGLCGCWPITKPSNPCRQCTCVGPVFEQLPLPPTQRDAAPSYSRQPPLTRPLEWFADDATVGLGDIQQRDTTMGSKAPWLPKGVEPKAPEYATDDPTVPMLRLLQDSATQTAFSRCVLDEIRSEVADHLSGVVPLLPKHEQPETVALTHSFLARAEMWGRLIPLVERVLSSQWQALNRKPPTDRGKYHAAPFYSSFIYSQEPRWIGAILQVAHIQKLDPAELDAAALLADAKTIAGWYGCQLPDWADDPELMAWIANKVSFLSGGAGRVSDKTMAGWLMARNEWDGSRTLDLTAAIRADGERIAGEIFEKVHDPNVDALTERARKLFNALADRVEGKRVQETHVPEEVDYPIRSPEAVRWIFAATAGHKCDAPPHLHLKEDEVKAWNEFDGLAVSLDQLLEAPRTKLAPEEPIVRQPGECYRLTAYSLEYELFPRLHHWQTWKHENVAAPVPCPPAVALPPRYREPTEYRTDEGEWRPLPEWSRQRGIRSDQLELPGTIALAARGSGSVQDCCRTRILRDEESRLCIWRPEPEPEPEPWTPSTMCPHGYPRTCIGCPPVTRYAARERIVFVMWSRPADCCRTSISEGESR